ncbi:MAG: Gfo/Idh/MocA family oxidoreductase [Albidovulum sp.]|nr:Gfo/Idh/MocA family oxidoreductase [Albidovulum sp.]
MEDKPRIRVGLVGAGFMGRCHANAFRSVAGIFDLPAEIELEILADADEKLAAENASELGFRRATGDWRKLASDLEVDVVAIAAPNSLHEPIATDAIANGKSVYCEKPLAVDSEAAKRMMDAAELAGATTLVGFNFLSNPLMTLAREMVQDGDIGDVTCFRGRHAEDYMASGDSPHTFRTDPAGGGALADLGSHIIAMARYLVGPIIEVGGNLRTIHETRPESQGSSRLVPVEVDDVAYSHVVFENGAAGVIEANWAASGKTMDLSFEITGSAGSIVFTQERMNELRVWRRKPSRRHNGFTIIESGPDHPPYGRFCPAPGHQLGFNDLKVIEVSRLIHGIVEGRAAFPDFREAYRIQLTVDAIRRSSTERRWIRVFE